MARSADVWGYACAVWSCRRRYRTKHVPEIMLFLMFKTFILEMTCAVVRHIVEWTGNMIRPVDGES